MVVCNLLVAICWVVTLVIVLNLMMFLLMFVVEVWFDYDSVGLVLLALIACMLALTYVWF